MIKLIIVIVILVLAGFGTTEIEKSTMGMDETSIVFNEALKNQFYESMENDFVYDKKTPRHLNKNKFLDIFENISCDVNLVFDAKGLIADLNLGQLLNDIVGINFTEYQEKVVELIKKVA